MTLQDFITLPTTDRNHRRKSARIQKISVIPTTKRIGWTFTETPPGDSRTHTLFQKPHRTFNEIYHILGHTTNSDKFKQSDQTNKKSVTERYQVILQTLGS